jgi:hypothetical protein
LHTFTNDFKIQAAKIQLQKRLAAQKKLTAYLSEIDASLSVG